MPGRRSLRRTVLLALPLVGCAAGPIVGETETPEETPEETGGETGRETGERPAAFLPPAWLAEAAWSTVPADRGLRWEKDPDFAVADASVPQVFVAPDGRLGMALTVCQPDTISVRSVAWSEDGRSWSEPEVLLRPEDFPYTCGERLEDVAIWREDAETWTFLFEGAELTDGEFSTEPRQLCAASTVDAETWRFDDAALWSGAREDDRISVPAVLPFAEEGALLWYNGDILGATPEGPGIRVATLDPATRAVTPLLDAPIMRPEHVDPMPVWREGGGVRLYHTRYLGGEGTTGLRVVDLGDDLLPVDDGTLILPSPGQCDLSPEGECYMDPSFVALPDGTLQLYFTDMVFEGDAPRVSIGRAIAVD